METVQTLNLQQLHHEEAFGFFTVVKDELENLPADPEEGSSILTAPKAAYESSYAEFDKALEGAKRMESVMQVTVQDAEADEAWRSSYGYLKIMARHPDPEKQALALRFLSEYEKYGNPTQLPQLKELGILQNLCTDINTLVGAEDIAFDAWREYLNDKTTAFQRGINARTAEASRKQAGIVKSTRLELEEAYSDLIKKVNAAAIFEGKSKYATFIDHLNALIDRQKSILKTRSTLNKKNKEKEA